MFFLLSVYTVCVCILGTDLARDIGYCIRLYSICDCFPFCDCSADCDLCVVLRLEFFVISICDIYHFVGGVARCGEPRQAEDRWGGAR